MATSEEPGTADQDVVHVWEGAEVEPRAAGTIYKAQIGVAVGSLLARDQMVVTPHFHDRQGLATPAAVASALASNMVTYLRTSAYAGVVKLYLEDFNPGAPHQPLAVATFGTQTGFLPANGPRELALCLSYYDDQNTKRHRGRLFIPLAWLIANAQLSGAQTLSERPTATEITSSLNFGGLVLKPIGAQGVDWCVASTVDKVARAVQNYWVDDEWDVRRSRGLRGSSRQTATIP